MARLTRIGLVSLVLLAIIGAGWWWARDYIRRHPQNLPWTPLRLDDPVGTFTLRKIAALTDNPASCRAKLREAGVRAVAAPPHRLDADCGYIDGIRIVPADGKADLAPAGLITSCPVAAAMTVFERQVLQSAAERRFGVRVAAIHQAGSFSCRRINNRADGPFSEHATADAIDVTGFTLADGRRISVLHDWTRRGAKADFLRDVRDGACRLFATVLSPDYNAAHADHLHFDQAERGRVGAGVCS